MTSSVAHRGLWLAVGLTLALPITGCSKDKPAVCSDVDGMKATISSLRHVSIGSGAITQVQTDLTTLQGQWTKFKADAKGQFSSEITNVQQALDGLSTAVTAAKANKSAATIAAVASAAGGVGTAADQLITTVKNTC